MTFNFRNALFASTLALSLGSVAAYAQCSGRFQISAGGEHGTLDIYEHGRNRFTGTISLRGYPTDEVEGRCTGRRRGRIEFTRYLSEYGGARQHYSGRYELDRRSGHMTMYGSFVNPDGRSWRWNSSGYSRY